MSDTPHSPTESTPGAAGAGRSARARWQVGIRTLILLTAAFAAWMTFLVNRRHNALLQSRIEAMRSLAHELVVDDARKIAVVKLEELWMDENQWDLHLPAGRYRLCLATHELDREGFPPVATSAPLKAGRHRLVLLQRKENETHRVAVLSDGNPLVTFEEPKAWDPGIGSEGGGQFSTSVQLDPGKPVVLFRRRFMQPTGVKNGSQIPMGPANGLMIWIEPVAGPAFGP